MQPEDEVAGESSTAQSLSRKKQKQKQQQMRTVRNIPAPPTISNGPTSTSTSQPLTTPSAIEAHHGGLHRRLLPSQLDVSSALSVRAAQVRALLHAMRTARSSRTVRAWQLLPRHMRRRAASHNLLRLPARLRAKGARELAASRTSSKTRAETRARAPDRTWKMASARLRALRQRAGAQGKRWLETHLWHAKRFHMTRSVDDKVSKRWRLGARAMLRELKAAERKNDARPAVKTSDHRPTSVGKDTTPLQASEPQTGFVLAETPHMKAHRASWRSATQDCILHDASYDASLLVACEYLGVGLGAQEGEEEKAAAHEKATLILARVLKRAGLAAGWADESAPPAPSSSSTSTSTSTSASAPPPSSSKAAAAAPLRRYLDGSHECCTALLGKPGGRVLRAGASKKATSAAGGGGDRPAEEDMVLTGELEAQVAERAALEAQLAEARASASASAPDSDSDPSSGRSMLSYARLLAPVRLLWLPAAHADPSPTATPAPALPTSAKRQVLLRCPPNALAALRHALSVSVQEEREMQRIQHEHRCASSSFPATPASGGAGAMQVDGDARTAAATAGAQYRIALSMSVVPNAPAPEQAVQSGRKSDKKTLRARLKRVELQGGKKGKKSTASGTSSAAQPGGAVATSAAAEKVKGTDAVLKESELPFALHEHSATLWRAGRLSRKEKIHNHMRARALERTKKRAAQKMKGVDDEAERLAILAHARKLAAAIKQRSKASAAPTTRPSVEHEGFNIFELVGPDSGRLLGGVLRPVAGQYQEKNRLTFKRITRELAVNDAQAGTVVALDVHDPRLR